MNDLWSHGNGKVKRVSRTIILTATAELKCLLEQSKSSTIQVRTVAFSACTCTYSLSVTLFWEICGVARS